MSERGTGTSEKLAAVAAVLDWYLDRMELTTSGLDEAAHFLAALNAAGWDLVRAESRKSGIEGKLDGLDGRAVSS